MRVLSVPHRCIVRWCGGYVGARSREKYPNIKVFRAVLRMMRMRGVKMASRNTEHFSKKYAVSKKIRFCVK